VGRSLGTVVRYILERQAATVEAAWDTGTSAILVSLNASGPFPPEPVPLTLRVPVPSDWTSVEARLSDETSLPLRLVKTSEGATVHGRCPGSPGVVFSVRKSIVLRLRSPSISNDGTAGGRAPFGEL